MAITSYHLYYAFAHTYTRVHRTATKSEISKAYRKLARKWHPDAYDGKDQEHAEKMFIDIAAAKEVLTDPGKLYIIHSLVPRPLPAFQCCTREAGEPVSEVV